MISSIPDLWPPDLQADGKQLTPLAILRRQGLALGEKSFNLVYGEVQSRFIDAGRAFEHTLVVVAPLLGYRVPLLKVTHKISLYPATIVEAELTKGSSGKYWSREATDEAQFVKGLQDFFARPATLEVVRALMSQSHDFAPEDSDRNGSSS